MKWLITTSASVDVATLRDKLASWGCHPSSQEPPIPLGTDEQVIEVVCPAGIDLREKTKDEAVILQINPSSEMHLYGPGSDF
ncbi:MAG: hypothetical protein WAN46_05855 [Gammaproteobacteria bacterium]